MMGEEAFRVQSVEMGRRGQETSHSASASRRAKGIGLPVPQHRLQNHQDAPQSEHAQTSRQIPRECVGRGSREALQTRDG